MISTFYLLLLIYFCCLYQSSTSLAMNKGLSLEDSSYSGSHDVIYLAGHYLP